MNLSYAIFACALAASAASAQTPASQATPQTRASRPAAVAGAIDAAGNPVIPGVAPTGNALGSNGSAGENGSGSNRTGSGARSSGGGSNGSANTVTGVPGGYRGTGVTRRAPRSTPAPAATASVAVVGADGSGRIGSSTLPGIATMSNALGLPPGTPILVRLKQPIDSGHARNGDVLDAELAQPLGGLPAGTPAQVTVVAAAPAGTMRSCGELSIQITSVGGHNVLSNVVTAEGEEGKRELPDASPARGTEAVFTPDKPISLPSA